MITLYFRCILCSRYGFQMYPKKVYLESNTPKTEHAPKEETAQTNRAIHQKQSNNHTKTEEYSKKKKKKLLKQTVMTTMMINKTMKVEAVDQIEGKKKEEADGVFVREGI